MNVIEVPLGILQLINQLEVIADRLVPGYEIHYSNIFKYLTYWKLSKSGFKIFE